MRARLMNDRPREESLFKGKLKKQCTCPCETDAFFLIFVKSSTYLKIFYRFLKEG